MSSAICLAFAWRGAALPDGRQGKALQDERTLHRTTD